MGRWIIIVKNLESENLIDKRTVDTLETAFLIRKSDLTSISFEEKDSSETEAQINDIPKTDQQIKVTPENLKIENKLHFLRRSFLGTPPKEIVRMELYIALRENQFKKIEDLAYEGCRLQDGLSCYIYNLHLNWKNIGYFMKETKDFKIKSDSSISSITDLKKEIQNIKTKSSSNNSFTPLKEDLTIDQKDIEELDSIDAKNNAVK